MARDLDVVTQYCEVSALEREMLESSAAPIVLLNAHAHGPRLPGVCQSAELPPTAAVHYGFMLPTTPLHVLLLQHVTTPVVCTSGNRSDEPQVIDDAEVFERLGGIADWVVSHDRPIQHRVDDSVVRVFAGRSRVLRRARGLAPAPLPLPDGFAEIAVHERVFAAGADLKAALCLSRATDLVLSQHLGDLDNAHAYAQYVAQSHALRDLFEVRPTRSVSDNHSASRAAEFAREFAEGAQVPHESVPHHHAHFAACLGENGVARSAEPMLGIVLDGIGAGDTTHALWGAEVLVGDYAHVERLGSLEATALLGGDRAAREPWRCLYAQLRAALSWQELAAHCDDVPSVQRLAGKPIAVLEQMLEHGLHAPLASSCGRLFDAMAAALGLCFEEQTYEGQAAQALEALVSAEALARACAERAAGQHYPLPIRTRTTHTPLLHTLDPRALWLAVLADLANGQDHACIAARFHVALAAGFAELCDVIVQDRERSCRPVRRQVALSGGCLQNACLHGRLDAELRARGFTVLSHALVPANDGGIALGQALVSLARAHHLQTTKER
jgi:hydrogenase maturation protein HypF